MSSKRVTIREDRVKDKEILDVIKMMAPGTQLREGLDNILRARTGALIIVGDSSEVMSLVDGGFNINKEYSPSYLYELAKMDGAIILSKDLKRIIYANAFIVTDSQVPTDETGTRHKSAQRAARQTGETVVAISQRRNLISIYKGNKKYILRETSAILAKANQALQTMEKYRSGMTLALTNLSLLEFEDMVSLYDVAQVIQRVEMVMRVVGEIDSYIYELGNEGRLISMQLEELINNVEDEGRYVIEDYMSPDSKGADDIIRQIKYMKNEELMDLTNIIKTLGFNLQTHLEDENISPKGYRILNRIQKIPTPIVKNLVVTFENLQGILKASIGQLDEVEGIGEVRAKMVKEGLKRIREQLVLGEGRRLYW